MYSTVAHLVVLAQNIPSVPGGMDAPGMDSLMEAIGYGRAYAIAAMVGLWIAGAFVYAAGRGTSNASGVAAGKEKMKAVGIALICIGAAVPILNEILDFGTQAGTSL